MPYELGLDIGAIEYGKARLKNKRTLVLETERYYYQKVISDISGQDIENHDDDPYTLTLKVRNWISVNKTIIIPGSKEIWNAFNQFTADLNLKLFKTYSRKEIKEMPISDYIKFAKDWLKIFKTHL